MSGGHFDYPQHRIGDFIDQLRSDIEEGSKHRMNEFGDEIPPLPRDILKAMKRFLQESDKFRETVERLDKYMSGDIGDESITREFKKYFFLNDVRDYLNRNSILMTYRIENHSLSTRYDITFENLNKETVITDSRFSPLGNDLEWMEYFSDIIRWVDDYSNGSVQKNPQNSYSLEKCRDYYSIFGNKKVLDGLRVMTR